MSVMHCPLCIGLAVLSLLRAAAHVALVGLGFPISRALPSATSASPG